MTLAFLKLPAAARPVNGRGDGGARLGNYSGWDLRWQAHIVWQASPASAGAGRITAAPALAARDGLLRKVEQKMRENEAMDTAATLRKLEEEYRAARQSATDDEHAEAEVAREHRVSEAIHRHLDHAQLLALVAAMREAAERGAYSHLALRFPAEVCTDGGRRINSAQPDWPASLRGEAADVYRFWQTNLQPLGFQLTAEVLNFPGGKPGDIGLTFTWG
jgi:hypothetical protein